MNTVHAYLIRSTTGQAAQVAYFPRSKIPLNVHGKGGIENWRP